MAGRRGPVDRIVDALVAIPICTTVATRRSVSLVTGLTRRRVVVALTRRPPDASPAVSPVAPAADASRSPAPPDTSHGPGDAMLPIEGYDHLAARQVVDRLDSLTPAELREVERYERGNRHRRTVLGKIEQLST